MNEEQKYIQEFKAVWKADGLPMADCPDDETIIDCYFGWDPMEAVMEEVSEQESTDEGGFFGEENDDYEVWGFDPDPNDY